MTQDQDGKNGIGKDLPQQEGPRGVSILPMVVDAAHELRGPLNVILGMTELLEESHLAPEQTELIKDIRTSAEVLMTGINEITDVVNMANDDVRRQSIAFSLRTLLEDLGDLIAPKAEARGLELVLSVNPDVPESLVGDPTGVRRVLSILVNTAIRLARRGEIEVRASLALGSSGELLRLSVAYDGPAITFDGRRDIETGRTHEGVTAPNVLRLRLASRSAQLMGGAVKVERNGEGGTRLVLESAFEAVSHEGRTSGKVDVNLDGLKVLIADDSDSNRRLLQEILHGWGCETAVAADGGEALDRLHDAEGSRPFDLAILDFVMPDMDGATVARAIRAHLNAASMPLILLTSSPAPGDGERMREAGFDAYLTKPVTRLDLLEAIRGVLGQPPGGRAGLITHHTLRESRRSRLRILLVEDDETNRKAIAEMLQRLGHGCDLAANGEAAVRALARREYDAVLMDYQMPVMDGFEATRRIREREKVLRRRTPIIATTADALAGSPDTLRRMGMDEYIPKPIDIRELAGALARLTGEEIPAPEPSVTVEGGAEPVDASRLELMAGNDVGFLKKIVSMFLEESEGRLARLEKALKNGDLDAVRSEAHALKGAAGNVGAGEMASTAAALQRSAESKDRPACARLLPRLRVRLNEAGRWLGEYVNGLPKRSRQGSETT